jgi:regulatory protein YycI of two-component signal transduction system YycFG
MDLDPEARMSLTSRVRELSKQYVDQKEIRDYAEVEKACLECEAYENQITEGSLHDRAAIGYRLSALERVMKTGEVPDEELVDALAQADPQDRLKAGHAAV